MTKSRASGPPAAEDPSLPERYASLVIDALIDAGLVRREDATEATRVAAVEIRVRQAMGDR